MLQFDGSDVVSPAFAHFDGCRFLRKLATPCLDYTLRYECYILLLNVHQSVCVLFRILLCFLRSTHYQDVSLGIVVAKSLLRHNCWQFLDGLRKTVFAGDHSFWLGLVVSPISLRNYVKRSVH